MPVANAVKEVQTSLKAHDSEFNSPLESIRRSSTTGLVQLNSLAFDIFAKHPGFEGARSVLGTDEASQAKVLKAAESHNFPPQSTVAPELYFDLLRVVGQKEELARKLILEELDSGTEFGLKPFELDVLRASCEVGVSYDELCILWRQDVQGNPLNVEAVKLGLNDRYSVIIGNTADSAGQVSWHARYPKQVETISGRWRQLVQKLASYGSESEAVAMSNYFAKYADAFEANTKSGQYSTKEVDEMWLDVDRAWMNVEGRMQIVASREYGYYDPMRIRVIPDFRLILVTESSKDELLKTRKAMSEALDERYKNSKVYQETADGLLRVQVYPGADIVFSGTLDFQPSGQSLSNEQKVKDELGTRVLLNPDVTAQRWKMAKQLAKNVFYNAEDRELFDAVDPEIDMTIRYVGGHEYAEPLFQPPSVDISLGDKNVSLLNEDLANLCATLTIAHRISKGELNNQDGVRHAMSLLGTYLRLIDVGRGATHLQPYYVGHSLQGLRRMIETGFIYQDDSKNWHIDQSKVQEMFEANIGDLDRLIAIGDAGSKQEAEAYLAQAQETEQIRDIILKINPDATF